MSTGNLKWLCLGLCLTAGFTLSSCDDDEGEGGGGGGTPAQQPPKVADAGIQFPVTQYSEYSSYVETYTYADGRITGGSTPYGTQYSITQNPLTLTATSEGGAETQSLHNIQSNGSGFMTYAEYSYNYSDSIDSYYENASIRWEYDAEGHLLKESASITESSDGPCSWTSTYTWQDGNLMTAEYSYEEDGEAWRMNCTFTYDTSKWSNTGVFPAHMIEMSVLEIPILFYGGLLGRTTKNIPTSVTKNDYENDSIYWSQTYTTTDVNYNDDTSVRYVETEDEYGSVNTYRFGYAAYPINMPSYSAATVMQKGKAIRAMKKARRTLK